MRQRATVDLASMLERTLVAYTKAASMAGAGISLFLQPATAKVVYTPAHVSIGAGGLSSYSLDLNHDGVADFGIHYSTSCDLACYADLSVTNIDGRKNDGVEFRVSFHTCRALKQGKPISPKKHFTQYPAAMVQVTATSSGQSFVFGNWVNAKNRYLGLKFHANGKTHFGWARLSVRVQGFRIVGTLTGYAYETVPNKSISAGDKGAATLQSVSLGQLALGASAMKQHVQSTARH